MIEVWRFQDVIIVAQSGSRAKIAIPLSEVVEITDAILDAAGLEYTVTIGEKSSANQPSEDV